MPRWPCGETSGAVGAPWSDGRGWPGGAMTGNTICVEGGEDFVGSMPR